MIEDNPGDARLIREMLSEAGGVPFDLEHADRLSTGLERLAADYFDVILLDLGLPDSQGLDSLDRAQVQSPQIPIVILTDLDDAALAHKAVREGAQDYLVKGQMDSNSLIRSTYYAIERKRAEKSIRHLNSILETIRNVDKLIVVERDRDSLLQKTCDALINTRGYDAAWFGFLPDGKTFATIKGSGFRGDVSRFCDHVMSGDYPPCIKNALDRDDLFMIVDKSTECEDCLFKDIFSDRETAIIRAEYDSRIFGLLVVSLATDVAVEYEEMELLMDMAGDIAYALHDMEVREAHRQAEDALRESEEKYHALFETAKDAIFLTDDTGRFVDANQAACESLGYSKEELLKLSVREIDADPRGYEAFLKVRDGLVNGAVMFEVNQQRKDGTLLPVEITGSFFESGGRRISLAIARDITERKKAEKRIKEEYCRAEFHIDLMSHDINNTNQVTMGYLEMLLRMPDFPDKFRKYTQTALDHIRKSADIISNVKTLTKVRSGEIELEKVDIYPAYAGAVEVVESPSRDVRINSNITEGRYFIRGNALLFDVFSNLLNNAVKFDGHDIVEIDVDISSSDDNWRLEFKDRGHGISDDYKKIVFNRQERAGESAQGSGLGLTIVKHIVDSYGGSVWAEDRVKGDRTGGSNFIVLLPMED